MARLASKYPRQVFRAQVKSFQLAFLYRANGQSGQNVNNKAVADDRDARSIECIDTEKNEHSSFRGLIPMQFKSLEPIQLILRVS